MQSAFDSWSAVRGLRFTLTGLLFVEDFHIFISILSENRILPLRVAIEAPCPILKKDNRIPKKNVAFIIKLSRGTEKNDPY